MINCIPRSELVGLMGAASGKSREDLEAEYRATCDQLEGERRQVAKNIPPIRFTSPSSLRRRRSRVLDMNLLEFK